MKHLEKHPVNTPDTTTIHVDGVSDPVTVSTGDAKEMPAGLAEAMLGASTVETNAKETLHRLGDLAELSMNPAVRACRVAQELRDVGDAAAAMPLTLADARDGFAILGMGRTGDAGPVVARRRTCEELAALIGRSHPDAGEGCARRLAAVLSIVSELYSGSADERQLAIARTAIREVLEITGQVPGQ